MKLTAKGRRQRMAKRIAEDTLYLLDGEIDRAGEAQIMRQAEDSTQYSDCLLSSVRLMADMESFADNAQIQAVLDSYRLPRQPQPIRQRWKVLAVAATALLVISVGFMVIRDQPVVDSQSQMARHVTRVGEQKTVSLADGSVITLNTGTSLLVELSDTVRRIILERGEVYFDVAGDSRRPFSVDLGGRMVSVLGTEFNIHKSPDKFTVAVMEGVVAVHAVGEGASRQAPLLAPEQGQRVALKAPGQRKIVAGTVAEYEYGSEELVAYLDPNVEKRQGWRSGTLVFEDVPLSEVVQQLNRYSGKKILLESNTLRDRKIYAVIRIDRLSTALEGLQNTVPIKVVTHFDRIVLVDRKQ